MKVFNKRTDVIPEGAIYVGRPSKWGNPFVLSTKLPRNIAIDEYRKWIAQQPELMASLPELKGKDLVCFCAPLPCHADVLLELANKEPQGGQGEAVKRNTAADPEPGME